MTIPDMLRKVFTFVKEESDGSVVAKGHNRMPEHMPCGHIQHVRAVDISACIDKDGYLVSGDEPIRYKQVTYCQRCEKVQHSEALYKQP